MDLQYAWKMPRRSFDELRACRLAVQQAFEALPADMQDSVEVSTGATQCTDSIFSDCFRRRELWRVASPPSEAP